MMYIKPTRRPYVGFLFLRGLCMWICGSDFFLSIVEPIRPSHNQLLVRGRREGDIQSVFPDANVTKTVGRDYLFRAYISRDVVAAAIAAQVKGINYDNFKNSVRDNRLHDAYLVIWRAMADIQVVAPYTLTHRSK